jgi:quercetin dioxygenase-like cupin family protein
LKALGSQQAAPTLTRYSEVGFYSTKGRYRNRRSSLEYRSTDVMMDADSRATAQGLPTNTFGDVRPGGIHWAPFAAFPPEARLAVLVGDPAKSGPYVVRVKVPAGVKLMPHTHPEDRIYTVISGVFYIGLGDDFDPNKLVAYEPGSVVVLPGDTPHFHWARSGEYVTQVSGVGPLGINYVDWHDDPREERAPKDGTVPRA